MNKHVSAYPPEWVDLDASIAFLQRLREGGPWNLLGIRPDLGGGSSLEAATFTEPGEARAWIRARVGKANLYYQASPVAAPTGYKGRLRRADVHEGDTVHGDIDVDKQGGMDDLEDRKAATVVKLRALEHPPTAIIDTGGGLQCLWRIEPTTDVAAVERMNAALVDVLGADPGTWSIAQPLRLPGTINVPDLKKQARGRTPAPARLIEFNDRRYAGWELPIAKPRAAIEHVDVEFDAPEQVEDLDALAAKHNLSDRLVDLVRDGHTEGKSYTSRSEAMYSAVMQLAWRRVPAETILGIILDPNFAISASVLDKPDHDQLRYAERQVRNALSKIAAERTGDFDDEVSGPVEAVAPTTMESTYSESLAWVEPKWLVDGFVPFGGLVQNFGVRKAMKTFVTLDLALCVATGRDYHGQAVQRGKVTYVAAEGSKSRFRDRVTAWLRLNGVDAKELDGWWFQVNRPVNLTDKRETAAFIQALRDGPARDLIVFDTVAKNSGGMDEDTAGMKAFVNGANTVRFATSAAVLVIHHEGKDASKKGRGSTVLPGDVDLSIRTQRLGNGRCTVSVDEARDTDEGKTLTFELRHVIIGELEDVSAAVCLVDEAATKPQTTDDRVLIDIVEEGEVESTKDLIDEKVEGRSKANIYKVVGRLREAGLLRANDPLRPTRKGVDKAMLMGATVPDDEAN